MPFETYCSEMAENYDTLYRVWGKNYQKESNKIHLLIQKNKVSRGNTLLDLGCGTGEHIRFLQENYKIVGLDISPAMLNLAQKKFPQAKFIKSDMANIEIKQKFDVVLSLFSSIAYVKTVKRLEQTIKSISQRLRTGGVVIIEPWYTRDEYEKRRYNALIGEEGYVKACRMHETTYIDNGVKIKDYIMLFDGQKVLRFTSKHTFGFFSKSDFAVAFAKNGIQSHYIKGGLTGRGLHVGVKV